MTNREHKVKEAYAVMAGIAAAEAAETMSLALFRDEDRAQDARDEAYEKAYKAAGGSFERGWDADCHSGTTIGNMKKWIIDLEDGKEPY